MLNVLLAMSNKDMLMVLMGILIAFIVLLAALAIVFIVALRKRAPVVKVVMAPTKPVEDEPASDELSEDAELQEDIVEVEEETDATEEVPEEDDEALSEEDAALPTDGAVFTEEVAPTQAEEEDFIDEADEADDAEELSVVTEGEEIVRYTKSFTAKIIQCRNETKEWYSELKNELLSYKKVRARTSWKCETFSVSRKPIAKLTVRGKTLCLLLATDPETLSGTKYLVESVAHVASNASTPCMYRIKNARRAKYAAELIAALAKSFGLDENAGYARQDFNMEYESITSLMERGLVKRTVVTGTNSFFAQSKKVENKE